MKNPAYHFLMQHAKSVRGLLQLTITASFLSGLCVMIQAFLLAAIISEESLHFLPLFLGVTFIQCGLRFYREKWAAQTAIRVKSSLRQEIFSTWMNKTDTSEKNNGTQTTLLIDHIEALHGFFSDYLPQMVITCLLPLVILGVVFSENWMAGTLLLITAPLIPLFMILVGIRAAQLQQESTQLLSRLSAHFLNILQGLSTLSLFQRAQAQTASIEMLSDTFREKTMGILRVAFLSSAALDLFGTISIAMIAVYLGLGLLGFIHFGFSGVHITLEKALFILLLIPEFYLPLRQLGAFYHTRQDAIAAANEINRHTPLFS